MGPEDSFVANDERIHQFSFPAAFVLLATRHRAPRRNENRENAPDGKNSHDWNLQLFHIRAAAFLVQTHQDSSDTQTQG